MVAHIAFIIISFILDEILFALYPGNYLLNDLIFIPNIAFCAMILTIRKFDIKNACLFAFSCGMVYDFCFANTFLVYAIVFTIVASLLKIWSKHMTDTLIESLILCIVTIFVKDLMVYFYMSFERISELSLLQWAEHYELLTLLANAILVMVLYFLIRIKDDYLSMKDIQTRKGERVEWFRLKSKD